MIISKNLDVLDELKLKNSPERIYNLDENGCRVKNEHAGNTTIIACINALSQAVPPMIIFKGVRLKD